MENRQFLERPPLLASSVQIVVYSYNPPLTAAPSLLGDHVYGQALASQGGESGMPRALLTQTQGPLPLDRRHCMSRSTRMPGLFPPLQVLPNAFVGTRGENQSNRRKPFVEFPRNRRQSIRAQGLGNPDGKRSSGFLLVPDFHRVFHRRDR